MSVHVDIDIRARAESCIQDMGDVFWDWTPERATASGYSNPAEVATKSVEEAMWLLHNDLERGSLCPKSLREEYATLVSEAGAESGDSRLVAALVRDADWTRRGAAQV